MNTPDSPSRAPGDNAAGGGAIAHRGEPVVRQLRPRTPEDVQEWFLAYLAEALQVAPDCIDVKAPFEVLGLDSVTAVGMSGDLEAWLGFSVDPMSVFDYPTIESLSNHLAERSRAEGSSA
jgi:acyl carrier protein